MVLAQLNKNSIIQTLTETKNFTLKMLVALCDQWKLLQCGLWTGHSPSFFVPTMGHLAAQVSHPPGICHPRQKNANTRWSSLGGREGWAQLDLTDACHGELVRTLLRFSLLWEIVIIKAQSIPSVPIPPKAFVKYWHLLWLSTSEQKWTKLLKLSSLAKKICLKDTLLAELLRSFC